MRMSFVAKSIIIGTGFALVMSLVVVPYLNRISDLERKSLVRINEQIIIADVVNEDKDLKKGLAGRNWLGINEGMLFLFEREGIYPFWMKGVKFPIDIIWIMEDKIVGVEQHVMPQPGVDDTQLKLYYPPGLVNKVLELKAGRAQILLASPGDEVEVKPVIPLL